MNPINPQARPVLALIAEVTLRLSKLPAAIAVLNDL